MNRLVDIWNKHQANKKSDVPDGLTFGDVVVEFREDKEMTYDTSLDKGQIRALVAAIKSMHNEKANSLRRVSFDTLKRLGVKRDMEKAIAGIPSNTNLQFNEASVVAWMNNIDPNDTKAVKQLVAIDATLVVRTKG